MQRQRPAIITIENWSTKIVIWKTAINTCVLGGRCALPRLHPSLIYYIHVCVSGALGVLSHNNGHKNIKNNIDSHRAVGWRQQKIKCSWSTHTQLNYLSAHSTGSKPEPDERSGSNHYTKVVATILNRTFAVLMNTQIMVIKSLVLSLGNNFNSYTACISKMTADFAHAETPLCVEILN